MTAQTIARELNGRRITDGWIAKCPAHNDKNPSLSLRDAGGKILAHCHAGCAQEAVVDALKASGLWPARTEKRSIAEYNYTDEGGELLYQIVRYEPKDFRPRYADGRGGWIWRKHPRQILYRLSEVLKAEIIFVVEGEKDVESLRSYGFVGTTAAGGVNAHWLPSFTDALRGREAIVIPDNDEPGRERARTIAGALLGAVSALRLLELPDGVKDISDWFQAGHSECELIALLEGPANV